MILSAQGCSVLATSLLKHVWGNVAYLILHVSANIRRWDWLIPVFLLLANIVAKLSVPVSFSYGSRMSPNMPEK